MAKKNSSNQPSAPKSLHPLSEVFGFPADNHSPEANRYREKKLCPFNNKVPNCTKDKANDPLGTCSIFAGQDIVITCPVRFRENWLIADDAAEFFFPRGVAWTSLTEVRIKDRQGGSAGNIDVVLVSYDTRGRVLDFGALEVQAVYISGNIRRPFEKFMEDPAARDRMDWTAELHYPRPDYLSSSRKRLAPQLLYKGGIIHGWGRKSAVALNTGFFNTLPSLQEVSPAEAEIAWLVYDLIHDAQQNAYVLTKHKVVYTRFDPTLAIITKAESGRVEDFLNILQTKLDERLEENNPPDAPTLDQIV